MKLVFVVCYCVHFFSFYSLVLSTLVKPLQQAYPLGHDVENRRGDTAHDLLVLLKDKIKKSKRTSEQVRFLLILYFHFLSLNQSVRFHALRVGNHDLPCISIPRRFQCFCHSFFFEPHF